MGAFCLRKNNASTLILLATGTGIAPVKAILESLSHTQEGAAYDKIFLHWGGRTASDLYWEPIFDKLPLKFVPVLSREMPNQGFKGYVQGVVLNDEHVLSVAVVYACGSSAMIRAAQLDLIEAGLNKKLLLRCFCKLELIAITYVLTHEGSL